MRVFSIPTRTRCFCFATLSGVHCSHLMVVPSRGSYLNLQSLLRDGRDAASVSVPLQGKQGSAGQVVVSLLALDALRAASGEVAAAPVAAVSTAGPSSLRVDVGALTLTAAVKRDIDVADVWVEVDLLGLVDASALRTKRINKTSANLDFSFTQTVSVAPGGKQQAALRSALSSAQEQDADVYFVVKTLTARNQEREVGQG